MPLWRQGDLAFIHAAGSPDPNRSHFEAQRYIENGTPGCSTTPDGWMNRLLQALPGPRGPTDAISVGPTLARILTGKAPVANLPLGPGAARALPIDRPELAGAFDRLYAGGRCARCRLSRRPQRARSGCSAIWRANRQIADAGAPPPASFAARAARLGRLIGGDARIRLAFVGLGGWDTHVDQGGAQGQLANHLRPLGEGLAAAGPRARRRVARHGGRRPLRIRPHRARERRPRHRSRPRQRHLGRRRRGQGRAGSTANGRGWRRRSSISGAISRSPPIFARRWRRSSARIMGLADRQLELVFPGAPPAAAGIDAAAGGLTGHGRRRRLSSFVHRNCRRSGSACGKRDRRQ